MLQNDLAYIKEAVNQKKQPPKLDYTTPNIDKFAISSN